VKLNFGLDLRDGSVSINNTPGLQAQRLPFFTTAAGRFITSRSYFTEREGLENNYLLFYTVSGHGCLKYRGCEYHLLPGQAALIDCFQYQYYAPAPDKPWEFKWVHIGGMAAGEYEQRINEGSLNIVQLDEASKTGPMLDRILNLLQDSDGYLPDVKICSVLMEILTELIIGRQRPSDDHDLHKVDMEMALKYIRDNYGRRISVDDIISLSHVSKFYFLRLFKAYTGLGLYEYLNNHRIDMAKKMLKTTDSTVGCIALTVGFNDVNCFIRYFKKVTGITPATFRKYFLY
jgi:AraC-like DNA-binding protein